MRKSDPTAGVVTRVAEDVRGLFEMQVRLFVVLQSFDCIFLTGFDYCSDINAIKMYDYTPCCFLICSIYLL